MVYHRQNTDGGKRPARSQWIIPAAGLVVAILRLLVDARSLW